MKKFLELRHLKAIRAVADAGSLHRAALQLNTSQPALSRLIKEAEDRLGLALVERNSKGSHPTDLGQAVDVVARRILTDIGRLDQLGRDKRWSIKVGCIHRALDAVVPVLLQQSGALPPHVQLELRENDSQTLMNSLEQGLLDVAVLSPGIRVPMHIETQPLYVDQNVFVAGVPTACALEPRMSVPALAGHEFIAPAPGTPSRHEFDEYWVTRGVAPPTCRLAARTYDAIARSLPGSPLIAVLPRGTAAEHAANGFVQILDVEHSMPLRPVHVAWQARGLSPETRQVIALLRAQVGQRIDAGPVT